MPAPYTLKDLTIIVPGKDAQATVDKTLQSLLPAMKEGASCILINDGSRDATGEIMDRFASKWSTAEAVHLNAAGGAGRARNLGLDKTRTALMGTIDSDDWVGPEYYPSLISQMNTESGIDFVRTHYLECRGNQRDVVRAPFEVTNKAFDPRLAVMPDDRPTMVDHPQMWAGIYSMDFLNRHAIRYDELHTAEDRIMNWKTQILGRKMVIAEEFRFYYRRDHGISLTAIGDDRQLDFLTGLENVIFFLLDNGHERFLPKAVRQFMALTCFHLDKQERLAPDTQKKLVQGATQLLSLIPQDALDVAMRHIDKQRRDTIRELM